MLSAVPSRFIPGVVDVQTFPQSSAHLHGTVLQKPRTSYGTVRPGLAHLRGDGSHETRFMQKRARIRVMSISPGPFIIDSGRLYFSWWPRHDRQGEPRPSGTRRRAYVHVRPRISSTPRSSAILPPVRGSDRDRDLDQASSRQVCNPKFADTSGTPDTHGFARQLAVLKERMKTMQADYKTDIAMLGKQIAERDAKRDVEQARRDKENLRWQIGLWIAAVVIIGVLIRWPA